MDERHNVTLRVVELEEIRGLIDTPKLIQAIAEGFVLYSDGKVVVPPVNSRRIPSLNVFKMIIT